MSRHDVLPTDDCRFGSQPGWRSPSSRAANRRGSRLNETDAAARRLWRPNWRRTSPATRRGARYWLARSISAASPELNCCQSIVVRGCPMFRKLEDGIPRAVPRARASRRSAAIDGVRHLFGSAPAAPSSSRAYNHRSPPLRSGQRFAWGDGKPSGAGQVSGDAGESPGKRSVVVMIADGLGHGPLAAEAAETAAAAFDEQPFSRPCGVLCLRQSPHARNAARQLPSPTSMPARSHEICRRGQYRRQPPRRSRRRRGSCRTMAPWAAKCARSSRSILHVPIRRY